VGFLVRQGVWDSKGNGFGLQVTYGLRNRNLQKNLEKLAYYDSLTGLPNRILFEKRFNKLVAENSKIAVVDIDMDNFRHINNTLGYIFGNSCIKKVTEILALQLREDEFLAKIGGEHFGLLLIYETEEDITKRLELLLREIRKPFYREKETLFLTVSMGISFYSGNGEDFARMMQNAELAMFYRKENGKDGYSFMSHGCMKKPCNIFI
jgi:diguanylate cyclase (GGDEF)-like protein